MSTKKKYIDKNKEKIAVCQKNKEQIREYQRKRTQQQQKSKENLQEMYELLTEFGEWSRKNNKRNSNK